MSSEYDGDPRVVADGDGYRIPSPEGWTVTRHRGSSGGYWTAQSEDGQVCLDGSHYPQPIMFDTADAAIRHLLGPAQTEATA